VTEIVRSLASRSSHSKSYLISTTSGFTSLITSLSSSFGLALVLSLSFSWVVLSLSRLDKGLDGGGGGGGGGGRVGKGGTKAGTAGELTGSGDETTVDSEEESEEESVEEEEPEEESEAEVSDELEVDETATDLDDDPLVWFFLVGGATRKTTFDEVGKFGGFVLDLLDIKTDGAIAVGVAMVELEDEGRG